VAEEEASTRGAGVGKTLYFHAFDEDRVEQLVNSLKKWNRTQKRANAEYARGAIGSSLIARIGILLAQELHELSPERFYEIACRVAVDDVDNLDQRERDGRG
jgi:hypothetical protein